MVDAAQKQLELEMQLRKVKHPDKLAGQLSCSNFPKPCFHL